MKRRKRIYAPFTILSFHVFLFRFICMVAQCFRKLVLLIIDRKGKKLINSFKRKTNESIRAYRTYTHFIFDSHKGDQWWVKIHVLIRGKK